jgi:hypothetical protein
MFGGAAWHLAWPLYHCSLNTSLFLHFFPRSKGYKCNLSHTSSVSSDFSPPFGISVESQSSGEPSEKLIGLCKPRVPVGKALRIFQACRLPDPPVCFKSQVILNISPSQQYTSPGVCTKMLSFVEHTQMFDARMPRKPEGAVAILPFSTVSPHYPTYLRDHES